LALQNSTGHIEVSNPASVNLLPEPSPEAAEFHAAISGLYVYPVKSCAGVAVKEAILTETGLEFDRAWMVVDEAGRFLTQRELPRMALVQPQLKHYEMVLRAPGMLALHIKLDEVEAPARVHIWNDEVAAYDMGGIAAQWFTDFLGIKARLVRFDPEHKRVSSLEWTGDIEALNQFSDGYPLLVISQASLDHFNGKLTAAGFAAVGMERFRPNIVFGNPPGTGVNEVVAHDEDRLEGLGISTCEGEVLLRPVKPCLRCPIPNIDPATGLRHPAVLDTLQSYRRDARVNGALTFGMNLVLLHGIDHVLKPGQRVRGDFRFD
jgi:uncharacterized protein YcbX